MSLCDFLCFSTFVPVDLLPLSLIVFLHLFIAHARLGDGTDDRCRNGRKEVTNLPIEAPC